MAIKFDTFINKGIDFDNNVNYILYYNTIKKAKISYNKDTMTNFTLKYYYDDESTNYEEFTSEEVDESMNNVFNELITGIPYVSIYNSRSG